MAGYLAPPLSQHKVPAENLIPSIEDVTEQVFPLTDSLSPYHFYVNSPNHIHAKVRSQLSRYESAGSNENLALTTHDRGFLNPEGDPMSKDIQEHGPSVAIQSICNESSVQVIEADQPYLQFPDPSTGAAQGEGLRIATWNIRGGNSAFKLTELADMASGSGIHVMG